MEKLLSELVLKCYKSNLNIEISPNVSGLVLVYDTKNDFLVITRGYLKWEGKSTEVNLKQMHKKVDEYLKGEEI